MKRLALAFLLALAPALAGAQEHNWTHSTDPVTHVVTYTDSVTGKTLKLGRREPTPGTVKPQSKAGGIFAPLPSGLPGPPPATLDYTPAAIPFLYDPMDNLTLGDCVPAAIIHAGGTFIANQSQPATGIPFDDGSALALYEKACGYVYGNPATDTGCYPDVAIQYVVDHGLPTPRPYNNDPNAQLWTGAHKFVGYTSIDPTNQLEVETSVWLFENVFVGFDLPDAWMDPPPSGNGFVWDVAGLPDLLGHEVPILGYNSQGVIIDTWGYIGTITWAALAYYGVPEPWIFDPQFDTAPEVYTVYSPDVVSPTTGKAPNGFTAAQLKAYFAAFVAANAASVTKH